MHLPFSYSPHQAVSQLQKGEERIQISTCEETNCRMSVHQDMPTAEDYSVTERSRNRQKKTQFCAGKVFSSNPVNLVGETERVKMAVVEMRR